MDKFRWRCTNERCRSCGHFVISEPGEEGVLSCEECWEPMETLSRVQGENNDDCVIPQ